MVKLCEDSLLQVAITGLNYPELNFFHRFSEAVSMDLASSVGMDAFPGCKKGLFYTWLIQGFLADLARHPARSS